MMCFNMKKYNIDVMMAATAITEECILVSADAIYEDICQFNPQFRLDNWTA